MNARTWWIDQPLLLASSNPTNEELARFRLQGLRVVVSLLEEDKQPPKYDKKSATQAGWTIYSMPIEEGGVPSLNQFGELTGRLRALPKGTKVLVHCENGMGRAALIGAAYWISKGLTASAAITRTADAGVQPGWLTEQRKELLRKWRSFNSMLGSASSSPPKPPVQVAVRR
jgi:protein-tyrosine phosphatase